MERFTTLTAIAAPLIEDDVNTDQICPLQMQRSLDPDYAALLFARQRRRPDGSEIADFVLNRAQFRHPGILVSGRNFGCGSSREGAVWAMRAIGIRCVIARGLADIFRENILQNGMLPVELRPQDADAFTARVVAADGRAPFTVDLETQRIGGPGRPRHRLRHRAAGPHAAPGRPRRHRADAQMRRRDRRLGDANGRRAAMAATGGGSPPHRRGHMISSSAPAPT